MHHPSIPGSLLWQLQHGCIPTAKQLQHISPDNTDKCPARNNQAPDHSSPPPAPEHCKGLAHYFYECARVRRFWLLVGCFLISAFLPALRRTSLVISPREGAHSSDAWLALLPNHRVWHGLALWQIYCAHTETLFDAATIKTGDAMSARWMHEVM
ncbi:hypothetical protein H4R19_004886 [Coemansia spiralis]|nr:hypothetical protein H4R19_004886 [Coemansia spiralis]